MVIFSLSTLFFIFIYLFIGGGGGGGGGGRRMFGNAFLNLNRAELLKSSKF